MDCLSKGCLDKETPARWGSAPGLSTVTSRTSLKTGVHSRIEAVLKYLHK
jgi:hypothetical protein